MKQTLLLFLLILITGCGSSGDSAITTASNEPSNKKVELIFNENFDNQEDWHSGLLENYTNPYINDELGDKKVDQIQLLRTGHKIPAGWTGVRQGEQVFSPRDPRYPNSRENIEILSINKEKAMGKTGKSAVFWRDSYQDNNHMWNSDGILSKHFPGGFDEIYVEFWITFDKNTTTNSVDITNTGIPDMSKLFRIESWSEERSEFKNDKDGNLGPILMWTWRIDQWGVRNVIGTRGGPHSENYYLIKPEDFIGMPLNYEGKPVDNGSFNFTDTFKNQGPNGETEWPIDRLNGGLIKDNLNGYPTQEQVFGKEGQWTKVAFYVKMNSDFDKKDGVLIQWINGRRVISNYQMPWYKANIKNIRPKWNLVALGGNDYFHSHPRTAEREEWYAIDNVKVYSGIPDHAEEDINFNE